MSVSAVIVNYYTASYIPSLIEDLKNNKLVSRIVVIDNCKELTGNDNFNTILSSLDYLSLIINDQNIGFGAAINQAIEYIDTDWILLVNPDMRFSDNCIKNLLNAAKEHKTPIVGPRFFLDDQHLFRIPPATGSCAWLHAGHQYSAKYRIDAHIFSFNWIMRHERFWESKKPFFEPFLSGACILIEKDWIISRGGKIFDDRFFLYFEDTDLCISAVLDGINPLCVPDAQCVHYYDQAPSVDQAKSGYMSEAHQSFLNKYYNELDSLTLSSDKSWVDDFEIEDLGELSEAPIFKVNKDFRSKEKFFELGVNPYFVPFAQAPFKGDVFKFSDDVWKRLSKGNYFGRIRNKIKGDLNIWKWKKL
jgi:GT2 family glycosyltransferase